MILDIRLILPVTHPNPSSNPNFAVTRGSGPDLKMLTFPDSLGSVVQAQPWVLPLWQGEQGKV